MLIGSRIRDLRKDKGLSQEKLGKLVNVTKVSISCYENQTRSPDLETFELLVNALETTPDFLLGRDRLVISNGDEKYRIYLPKVDVDIINEMIKKDNLIKFLRKDPKRSIEYLAKKID